MASRDVGGWKEALWDCGSMEGLELRIGSSARKAGRGSVRFV